MTLPNLPPDDIWPASQDNAEALFDYIFAPWIKEMGLTVNVDCSVTCVGSGDQVAHAVLEFAF